MFLNTKTILRRLGLPVLAVAAVTVGSAGAASAAEFWGAYTDAHGALNGGFGDTACGGYLCGGYGGPETSVSSQGSHSEFGGLISVAASAEADLATGELHAVATEMGPVFGGSAQGSARFADTLHFDVGGLTGLIPIGVIATVHGSFGGNDVPGFGDLNPLAQGFLSLGISNLAGSEVPLQLQVGYRSSTPTTTSNPDSIVYLVTVGTWSELGPDRFVGTYYLDAADPGLVFSMQLDALVQNGGSYSDFGRTAALSFDLPDGVTFTSDSGVFLSGAAPEPAAWALMLIGFFSVGGAIRRRHAHAA
jgi:hypothetical protein